MGLGVGNIVSIGGGSSSSGAASGIQTINPGNNNGPTVTFEGVNGISVTSPSPGTILVDGAGASGVGGSVTKFVASFSNITSGIFTHGIGSEDVIVQVYTADVPKLQMIPDQIRIENSNQVSVLFNSPQTGRIVII